MGVVKFEQFQRYLSSPRWRAEQEMAAQELLDSVEDGLARALYGTIITPRPMTELAPITARTGQVATRYPVHTVTRLAGTAVAEDAALPEGWMLDRHRLYRTSSTWAGGVVGLASVYGGPLASPQLPAYAAYDGSVELTYMAGWGAEPALIGAIMKKAKALFLHNHDDTITARGSSGDPPQPIGPEDWTEAELAPLGVFRRLGGTP